MKPYQALDLGHDCRVVFHRTLRIPDDDGEYPLPPSLGHMPLYATGEHEWVVPVHRAEALWLGFDAPWWKPHALKVGIGGIDAISGEELDPRTLDPESQDYLVIPEQPWLDGINAGDGFIRQFVAVPLGEGKSVEAQLRGSEEEGGLTLALFVPRPGRFPEHPPARADGIFCSAVAASAPMGLAAGGRMRQEIYADEHGIDTWEPEPATVVHIDLVDALAFTALTRIPAPPPLDARTYSAASFPWFDLLEPTRRDIRAAERLASIRSLADLEGRDEVSLPIPEAQVVRLLSLRSPSVR